MCFVPVELKDQVMLRLKLLDALIDMSRFLFACTKRKKETQATLCFKSGHKKAMFVDKYSNLM